MTATTSTLPATGTHVSIWDELVGVDLRQRHVAANGIRTRVLEAGSGPVLVMIHGTGGHLEAYARNVRTLAEHFHVVLYDMVGHGDSDKPDMPYTIDVLSDHLIGVMDALGIERAHLSGESLGGWVAAWTAAHHPGADRPDRAQPPGQHHQQARGDGDCPGLEPESGARGEHRIGPGPCRLAVPRHVTGHRRARRAPPADTSGDHTLFIGEVVHFEHRAGDPLIFHSGTYRRLLESPDPTRSDEWLGDLNSWRLGGA